MTNIVLPTYLTYTTLFRVAEQPIVEQKVKPYNNIIGISIGIPIRMLIRDPTHLIIPSNIEIKGTRNHSPQLKQVFCFRSQEARINKFQFLSNIMSETLSTFHMPALLRIFSSIGDIKAIQGWQCHTKKSCLCHHPLHSKRRTSPST